MKEFVLNLDPDECEFNIRFVLTSNENVRKERISDIDDDRKRKTLENLFKHVSPKILGYKYIIEAVILYSNDKEKYNRNFVLNMYGDVSEKFNTTRNSVERGIDFFIKKFFDSCTYKKALFDYLEIGCISPKKYPSAKALIISLSNCEI